jgi:sialic acid synthase SpsE
MAGACIVEKHITYDRSASGPDHSASFDPKQFAEYVKLIRQAERMLGDRGPRRVLPCEADVRDVSRQSLVATRAISRGEAIDATGLTSMRPGTGISAERVDDVVGRRAARAIAAGEMLSADAIEGWA